MAATQTMQALGLSPGRPGNISVRWKDGMLITASGIRPEQMPPDADVVFADRTGAGTAAGKVQSSEWPFHRAIYEARAIAAPVLLPADEMARVAAKFKTYGKAADPASKRRAKTQAGRD